MYPGCSCYCPGDCASSSALGTRTVDVRRPPSYATPGAWHYSAGPAVIATDMRRWFLPQYYPIPRDGGSGALCDTVGGTGLSCRRISPHDGGFRPTGLQLRGPTCGDSDCFHAYPNRSWAFPISSRPARPPLSRGSGGTGERMSLPTSHSWACDSCWVPSPGVGKDGN